MSGTEIYYLNGFPSVAGKAKKAVKNAAKAAIKADQAKYGTPAELNQTKKKKGFFKKVISKVTKVVSAPVRLAAKGALEIVIPKAALSFLYLFINKADVLAAMPEKVKTKRSKQMKLASFITNKIGMKPEHLMQILRKGIQQKTGRTPEQNLKELFPGANIGFLPVVLPAIKVGLPFAKQLIATLLKLFGGGTGDTAEDLSPDSEDVEEASAEAIEGIAGLVALKKAKPKVKAVVKKVVKKKAIKNKANGVPATAKLHVIDTELVRQTISPKNHAAALQFAKKAATKKKAKKTAKQVIAQGLSVASTLIDLIPNAKKTNQDGVLQLPDGSLAINTEEGTTIKTPAGNQVSVSNDGNISTPTGTYDFSPTQQQQVAAAAAHINQQVQEQTGGVTTSEENVTPPPVGDPTADGYQVLPGVTVTPKTKEANNSGLLIGAALLGGALLLSGNSRKR